MTAEAKRIYTMEEYLALERDSDAKYEFWNGEIFAMSGGTRLHDQITGNVYKKISSLLEGKNCEAFTGNMQIKVPAALPYRYGDGSVARGNAEFEGFNGNDLLLNPLLIWEVLSPSTEAYDRGDKFTFYKSIPTFREYLLIAQHRPHITHYVKQSDGSWKQMEINDPEGSIYLPSIDCTLEMSDIYRSVKFGPHSLHITSSGDIITR